MTTEGKEDLLLKTRSFLEFLTSFFQPREAQKQSEHILQHLHRNPIKSSLEGFEGPEVFLAHVNAPNKTPAR
jgi:hypothetical protein